MKPDISTRHALSSQRYQLHSTWSIFDEECQVTFRHTHVIDIQPIKTAVNQVHPRTCVTETKVKTLTHALFETAVTFYLFCWTCLWFRRFDIDIQWMLTQEVKKKEKCLYDPQNNNNRLGFLEICLVFIFKKHGFCCYFFLKVNQF